MKAILILPLIVGLLFVPLKTGMGQNKGAEHMVLQGGKLGNVPFPHHLHQSALSDCNLCHNLFPQVSGSIEKLKAEGKLESKEAMNQCQVCHKQKSASGHKRGPMECSECHEN